VTLVETLRPYQGQSTVYRTVEDPCGADGTYLWDWWHGARLDLPVIPGANVETFAIELARDLARELIDQCDGATIIQQDTLPVIVDLPAFD